MGCRDAIALLDCCITRMLATQKETYVCYADVKAAFTSVSHKATDNSLREAGASAKTRRIFRAMYKSAQCRIRVTDPRTGEQAHSSRDEAEAEAEEEEDGEAMAAGEDEGEEEADDEAGTACDDAEKEEAVEATEAPPHQ